MIPMCFCCGYLEMTHHRVIVIGLVEAEDTWAWQKMCTLCHQLRGHGNRQGSPWIQWTVTLGGVSKQNSVVEATSFVLFGARPEMFPNFSKPPRGHCQLSFTAFSLEAVADNQSWYKLGHMEKNTKKSLAFRTHRPWILVCSRTSAMELSLTCVVHRSVCDFEEPSSWSTWSVITVITIRSSKKSWFEVMMDQGYKLVASSDSVRTCWVPWSTCGCEKWSVTHQSLEAESRSCKSSSTF